MPSLVISLRRVTISEEEEEVNVEDGAVAPPGAGFPFSLMKPHAPRVVDFDTPSSFGGGAQLMDFSFTNRLQLRYCLSGTRIIRSCHGAIKEGVQMRGGWLASGHKWNIGHKD